MSSTGTLWKLRAKLTELTLPATSVDATDGEEQEGERLDRLADHLGAPRAGRTPGTSARLDGQSGSEPEVGPPDVDDADAEMERPPR